MPRILLAEDDEIMRITLFDRLIDQGLEVDQAADGNDAAGLLKKHRYHVVISDIRMPGLDGLQLMEKVLAVNPDTGVILMTAYGSVDDAVTCLRKGAFDYILKPFDMDDLVIRVRRFLELQAVKARCLSLEDANPSPTIIGSSPAMQEIHKLIKRVGASDSTVLITGDSGTGKELVAEAIHRHSRRAKGPYVKINCAAIPDTLIESELFGHEKGAFTGAAARKAGKFEMAENGSILLDEIGELPLHMQAKLLRVLQEREIERVGGKQPFSIDVRIICATAKNIAHDVQQGKFREDLFYRLNVIPIELPPLTRRREDIAELCDHFLEEFSLKRGEHLRLSPDALQALMRYEYPGNVRELRNIIERASVLAPATTITVDDLPADIHGQSTAPLKESMNLATVLAEVEKKCIQKALQITGGNKTEAAELLGISRKNLWEKLKNR